MKTIEEAPPPPPNPRGGDGCGGNSDLHRLLIESSMESALKCKHPPEIPKTRYEFIQLIGMDKSSGQNRDKHVEIEDQQTQDNYYHYYMNTMLEYNHRTLTLHPWNQYKASESEALYWFHGCNVNVL